MSHCGTGEYWVYGPEEQRGFTLSINQEDLVGYYLLDQSLYYHKRTKPRLSSRVTNTVRRQVRPLVAMMTPANVDQRISAQFPDWSREQPVGFWDPGRRLLLAIRNYQYWRAKSGPFATLMCKYLVLRHHFWSVVAGADIPLNCDIGGGLLINHPNGIVIHPAARIGVNCLISQQVTVGINGRAGVPQIGGHVDIGAGAKILGPVHVGDHAKIGANAVVLHDVPAGAVAVGIPAKIKGVMHEANHEVLSRSERSHED